MSIDAIKQVIARHWGYKALRPLQEEAMEAVLAGRDSLVVMPTGGGKSLCYQAPAVLRGDTTVVVSPLIALMKDQVDGLRACGVPAVQLDSLQAADERYAYEQDILQGVVRLLFVSPERLVTQGFQKLLQRAAVRSFAIDEAHCISHWGHDFRPEYRQLAQLKKQFPQASVHAYTATATEQVRHDIVTQLGLHDPQVLVGNFDRPNLAYRILPRVDLNTQVVEILDRHKGEAGIIYCLKRADVDALAAELQRRGYQARPYHAGMTGEERTKAQDAFAAEQCDLIVATVAFGMGIDRSNIRFIVHANMPKSVEHYQQETGRAGRDGLEAECVLLYSGADVESWTYLIEKSATDPSADPSFRKVALRHLNDMARYAQGAVCRHKALVQYFGQKYEATNCTACDICLGDAEPVPDALVIAQKILSGVARVKESFGVNHVVGVLRGENTENIRKYGHDQLSTYRLLPNHTKDEVRDWVFQLIGQGVLLQQGDEYPILKLNPQSWEVMRGERSVRLVQPARRPKGEKPSKSKADVVSWEGVDRELFEALRELRSRLAADSAVPPYIIFHDGTLRDLARNRPSTREAMKFISGIGDRKLRDYGDRVLELINQHCEQRGLERDVPFAVNDRPAEESQPTRSSRSNPSRDLAFRLFRDGAVIDDVLHQTGKSRSTVTDYLCDFIRQTKPGKLTPWVDEALADRIARAARQVGGDRLKPIFLALDEKVPYDDIRLVLAHLAAK